MIRCNRAWMGVALALGVTLCQTAHAESDRDFPLTEEYGLLDSPAPSLVDYLPVDDDALREGQRWRDLTPEQRDRVRERYRRFQELPADQQARIRERRDWFKSLPPGERRELREEWQGLSPQERKQFRKRLKESRKRARKADSDDGF